MPKYFELLKNYNLGLLIRALFSELKRKVWQEFVKNSYAQNGEDLIIEKLFDKNFIGRYLEIGAYHPTRLSNTYRLYKSGWRGTVVEANPEVNKIFNKIRPKDLFLNIGISDKNSSMDYYQFLIPALNTFSKKNANESIKNGHKLENIIKIQTKKIDVVVDKKIDFLSIDTEGFDKMILKTWPWKKYKPRVICVENGTNGVVIFLKKQGYTLHRKTKYNSIFFISK